MNEQEFNKLLQDWTNDPCFDLIDVDGLTIVQHKKAYVYDLVARIKWTNGQMKKVIAHQDSLDTNAPQDETSRAFEIERLRKEINELTGRLYYALYYMISDIESRPVRVVFREVE